MDGRAAAKPSTHDMSKELTLPIIIIIIIIAIIIIIIVVITIINALGNYGSKYAGNEFRPLVSTFCYVILENRITDLFLHINFCFFILGEHLKELLFLMKHK